jgi:outer membrane immunogenic protein
MSPGGFVLGVEADIQAMSSRNRNNGFGAFGGFGGFQTAAPTAQFGTAALGFGVAPGTTPNVAFFNNVGGNGFGNNNRSGNWFGTARLRAGFAVDRALFYVTGGLAFTDRRDNNNFGAFGFGTGFASGAAVVAAAPAGFFVGGAAAAAALVNPTGVGAGAFAFGGRNNDNNIGWALGGGVEYAWTNNLSVKLEALWLNFGRNNNNGFASGCCVAGQVVGVTNTGAPVFADTSGAGFGHRSQRDDIAVVRAGLNFKFNTP